MPAILTEIIKYIQIDTNHSWIDSTHGSLNCDSVLPCRACTI